MAYKKLKSAFELTFLLSAIILSAFVLWAGILFNGINSIEAMRFYSFLSGKPFLNYDFVYLVGLMHTLLLLIFYVPVRLRFNSLEIKKEQDAKNQLPGSKKYLTVFWDSLSTILVTTSPIITTILQKILTGLFSD